MTLTSRQEAQAVLIKRNYNCDTDQKGKKWELERCYGQPQKQAGIFQWRKFGFTGRYLTHETYFKDEKGKLTCGWSYKSDLFLKSNKWKIYSSFLKAGDQVTDFLMPFGGGGVYAQ